MPEQADNNAQVQEPQKNEQGASTEAVEQSVDSKQEATVGEVLNEGREQQSRKEETVPLSALIDLKKANKELTKELKDIRKEIEAGASRKEVSASLKDLSEKHNVDVDFLQDFAAAVREEAKKEVEGELKPLRDKEKADHIDSVFKVHFGKAIEAMPEYEGIVNKGVIKSLSLLPQNANKTFTQLIEESYGHLVTGKRSIDAASARAGKTESVDVDQDRAKKDPEYFKEVMANPILKKKYNEAMMSRISSYI